MDILDRVVPKPTKGSFVVRTSVATLDFHHYLLLILLSLRVPHGEGAPLNKFLDLLSRQPSMTAHSCLRGLPSKENPLPLLWNVNDYSLLESNFV